MDFRQNSRIFLLALICVAGCAAPVEVEKEQPLVVDLGATIGSLAEVFVPGAIPVEGYALIGGLYGTGSSECPPAIRTYLRQYILKQLPKDKVNIDDLIDSRNTAVVVVRGTIPTTPLKNQYFDLEVAALAGTQTTSLENGWLYGTELKPVGAFGLTVKVLAEAQGPIYIDKLDKPPADKKSGYILAGGTVLDEYKISITLRRPNFEVASIIRNRLNERFGANVAKAVSAGQIQLTVPARYKNQQQRFIEILRAMYVTQTPEITEQRITSAVGALAASTDKYAGEIALEAIGNQSLGKLSALLTSSNPEVRFRAARCMLNMDSDRGLEALRRIAMDKNSDYRIEAIEAVTAAADRRDAAAISRILLRDDDDPDVRLAAYEQLRKLDDIVISQKLIARNFYIEKIVQTRHKGIFVARTGQPRIVLFSTPLKCRENIFVQSEDGTIAINSRPGQGYVSIIRKHPKRTDIPPISIRSSYNLADIIEALCEESVRKDRQDRTGLSVTYSDMLALLQQMSEKGAIDAPFRPGPLPKITPIIKN